MFTNVGQRKFLSDLFASWNSFVLRSIKACPKFSMNSEVVFLCGFDIAIDPFACSMRFFWYPCCYGWWHLCHMAYVIKMTFYGILWHMPDDIECHELCQYGYQKKRIDQTKWSRWLRISLQEQNIEKFPKN